MDIFLTNNLSNKKEQFVPKNEKNIGMYVCGPTVYDDPHIGNARPLVIFDILYKVLKNKFSKVTYVRNITDIDDKIIKSSQDQNISTKELTEKVAQSFLKDCDFLNCENPTFQPKATEHIDLMIKMISKLIEKGFAYENNNHVYFEVKKFSDYGKLSNKKLEDLIAGSRIEVSDNKKNSEDFVLWKPSNQNEPSWDSPWGKGRPGWHLECSAMSKKFLGNEFDLRSIAITAFILIWALRLGSYLFLRILKDREDRRFKEWKTSFPLFLRTWTMQGMWVFLTSVSGITAICSRNIIDRQ